MLTKMHNFLVSKKGSLPETVRVILIDLVYWMDQIQAAWELGFPTKEEIEAELAALDDDDDGGNKC